MRLYHATNKENLESIMTEGIHPKYSHGKKQVCWYHTQSRIDWAVLHVSIAKKINPTDVVIIEVDIPRSRLTRRRRGIWITSEPVTELLNIQNWTPDASHD